MSSAASNQQPSSSVRKPDKKPSIGERNTKDLEGYEGFTDLNTARRHAKENNASSFTYRAASKGTLCDITYLLEMGKGRKTKTEGTYKKWKQQTVKTGKVTEFYIRGQYGFDDFGFPDDHKKGPTLHELWMKGREDEWDGVYE